VSNTLSTIAPPTATSAAQPSAKTVGTVKQMEGVLWYEMLSELNKNGLDTSSLGAGSDAFQDSFLWNLAQNDFSKYDTALTAATITQIGGRSGAAAPVEAAPIMPLAAASAPLAVAAVPIAAPMTAAAPAAATPTLPSITQATAFARKIWPDIVSAANALGIPPVAVLAQTALETGWGAAAPGNNLFGVKAASGQTHEDVAGTLQPQSAMFRNYDSTSASVSDYVGQIKSDFQSAMGQTSISGFADALQAGGYATDSNYAAKIVSISQSPMMTQVLQSIGTPAKID